jgi:hypothetical protein
MITAEKALHCMLGDRRAHLRLLDFIADIGIACCSQLSALLLLCSGRHGPRLPMDRCQLLVGTVVGRSLSAKAANIITDVLNVR